MNDCRSRPVSLGTTHCRVALPLGARASICQHLVMEIVPDKSLSLSLSLSQHNSRGAHPPMPQPHAPLAQRRVAGDRYHIRTLEPFSVSHSVYIRILGVTEIIQCLFLFSSISYPTTSVTQSVTVCLITVTVCLTTVTP